MKRNWKSVTENIFSKVKKYVKIKKHTQQNFNKASDKLGLELPQTDKRQK